MYSNVCNELKASYSMCIHTHIIMLPIPQDSPSTRSAWHTPPSSGSVASLPHHQTEPPPRPPSSSSSSHRTRSRSRQRSARGSQRHTIAEQLSQHSSSEKPPLTSLTTTSVSLHNGSGDTTKGIGSDNSHSNHTHPSSTRVSVTSRDLSTSSGVGSSVSSFVGGHLNQTGGSTMSEFSMHSSSLSTAGLPSSNGQLRRQPDSLPRVGKITGTDRTTLTHSQSSTRTATGGTTDGLHRPQPLFDSGKSSTSR